MAHIVMVYIYDKSINSNLLPSFNSGYINSCVIKDTDLGNNLIQREITNEEALPTSITMSNQPSLIEILECNATNCNHLSQSFYSNANLKRCKIQVGGEVNSLSHILFSCSKLEYLDLSNSDFSSCTDTTNALNLNVIETLNLENVKFTNSTVDLIRRCSSSLSEINLDNVDTSLVTDMSNMFSGKVNLTELNLSSFDTSSVTNMNSMFSETLFDCLDLSNFNISNVSNFECMLKNCKNLKVFKLSQSKFPPNETEVTMREMFSGCTSIEVLDLSNIKLKKIKTIEKAFYNMSSLKELNICNFRTNSDVSMSHVFYQAANLEILDVSNIDLSKTTDWHNAFINCAKLKHIGAMYCNAETINNIAKNLRSTATFYLNEEVGGLSVGNNSVIVKPYKTNILTVNEDVTLRSNGSVCDELDLLTGKLTQRIDEDGEILTQEVVKTVDLSNNHVYSYKDVTHYDCSSAEGSLVPTLSIDVPTNLPAMVTRQKTLIHELEVENKALTDELQRVEEKGDQADLEQLSTTWEIDYRVSELEWFIEDNMSPTMTVAETINLKLGGNTMALSRFEQAKIMILGGAYNRETLERQLKRYYEKGDLTKDEYETLIALMDAKELVTEN